MEVEHVQPVESVAGPRRARLPVPIAVALPIVVLVAAAGLGVLGRVGGDQIAAVPLPGATSRTADARPATPAPGEQDAAPDFPAEVEGLPVLTVPDVVASADAEVDGSIVAVAGWLTVPPAQANCGVTRDPGATAHIWSLLCWRETVLLADPEPYLAYADDRLTALRNPGPHLRQAAMPGTPLGRGVILRDFADGGALRPRPVVMLGRFTERPTPVCSSNVERCDRTFVIERVVWIAGQWQTRTARRAPDLDLPRMSMVERRERLRDVVPDSPVVLREVFLAGSDLIRLDPAAAAAVDATLEPVWYVRALRGGPAVPQSVAWLVVDDATGEVLASGES